MNALIILTIVNITAQIQTVPFTVLVLKATDSTTTITLVMVNYN